MPENKTENNHQPHQKMDLISPELLMDAPIGIYTTTPEGRFLFANRTLAKMLGYDTPEELIESITDLSTQVYVRPDDRKKITLLLETYGAVHDYECQWIRRNKKAVWVSLNGRAFRDESGNIIYYQGFASNIAKRKHDEKDLRKIEWMLAGDPSTDAACEFASETHLSLYGDLTKCNTRRLILDAVGEETLRNIINDYLDMLGTSAAVYEKNGDYALRIFSSSWCRFMDQASRSLCNTEDNEEALASGKWVSHESCWHISKQCIETGEPVDGECDGGLRTYAVPVRAGGEIIGAINFGYGNPPTDPATLDRLASKYKVSKETLRQHARSYETRPPFIIDLARRRIQSAAYLIGEIVARKQTERSLEETVDRLQRILDHSPLLISEISPKGRYLLANKALAEAYNLSVSEIVGKTIDELLPEDTARLFTNRIARAMDAAMPITVEDTLSIRGTERTYITTLFPLFDANGKTLYTGAIAHDITEQKQAEAALREKTQLLQSITDNMFDLVALTDMQGNFTYVGRSHESLGYDLDALIGKNVMDFVHPDDSSQVNSAFEEFITTQDDNRKVEYRYRAADGTYRWFETVGRIIRDENGAPKEIIFSTRDFTDRKVSEDLLRKREAFTRTVLDNLPIGLSINTVDDFVDFTYMNDNFPRIYRTTREAFESADSFWDVVYEDPVFREKIKKRVVVDCASGDPERMQWDDIPFTRNGETYYICARNIPLPDEKLMLSTVWDVTRRNRIEEKRKQAFAKLGRRTKELEALLEGAKSVIEIDDFHSTARRLFDAACDITGARSGYVALLNESGEENEILFLESGGLECTVDPYLPMPIRGLRSKAYETGKAVFDNDFMNSQWVDFMPAGHVVLKNVLFAPLNIKGKTVGIIGLANKPGDFTDEDRQVSEAFGQLASIALINSRNLEALEASEEKYRSILATIEDGYFEVDIAGNLTFFNDSLCRILGYSRAELMGMNNKEFMDKENARNVFKAFHHVFTTREPLKAFDWELIKKNGEKSYIDTSVSLILDGKGSAVGFRGVARDVTDRKKAEADREVLQDQLNQAQKMESVGRLAGGVAHDFNNMLTIINGYAEMMADLLPPSDPMHENVGEIRAAGKRAAIVVRKLLAFARKQTISPLPMNLNDSVSSMLKMLQRLIGENIDLLWKPGKNTWPVKMDFSQVDQILANLVVNARDAIADTGKIIIGTANTEIDEHYCAGHAGFVPGQYVMLAVSDNGCGMDKDVLENLFEPFFTTKEVGQGTGLGMPTVYGIVKQNNGFINVYSEPGQGTTIRIYLPRFLENADVPNKKKEEAVPRGRGETILVLEDETVVLNITRVMLARLGYEVITANSPSEAMASAKAHEGKIDLLITDIVMPEMNGREFADQIKGLFPDIKVLYMSGYTADVIAHHTLLDEGLHFIEKPFSSHKLAGKVREVLD
ncbi:MAG: PAS domain S-box protein [Desulfosalsimonadaceae bacterium]